MKKPTTKPRRGNPLGKGKAWVSTQIDQASSDELNAQAAAAGMTRSAYAGLLITDGLADPITLQHVRASGKVITYLDPPSNPTARAADGPA